MSDDDDVGRQLEPTATRRLLLQVAGILTAVGIVGGAGAYAWKNTLWLHDVYYALRCKYSFAGLQPEEQVKCAMRQSG